MFKCEFSGEVSNRGEKPVCLVIQKRDKKYFNDYGDLIGTGSEIVKTMMVHEKNVEAVKAKFGADVRRV